jgi:alpha-D-ribose 1-methylphosphonate 5-triphosphate synthase subunit PhnG
MEINLQDLMDKSEITTDDLDYIVKRLDSGSIYDMAVAFIRAYMKAREGGIGERFYDSELKVAKAVIEAANKHINYLTDDSFP